MEWFEVTWWMWMLLALLLAAIEILTPGVLLAVFFAAGAALVAILDLAGIRMGFAGQGLIFVSGSVCALLFLRKPLLQRFQVGQPTERVDNMVGETAQALEDIAADAFGKAELRGAAWNVHNIGDRPIARSSRCRVERIEGLTLYVRGA